MINNLWGIENYLIINSSNLADMPLYLKIWGVIQCLFQVRLGPGLIVVGVTEKKCIISRKYMVFYDVRTKYINGLLVLPSPTN